MNILVKHLLSVAALVFALGAAFASNVASSTQLYSLSTNGAQQLCTITVCFSRGFQNCSVGPDGEAKHYRTPNCPAGQEIIGFRVSA